MAQHCVSLKRSGTGAHLAYVKPSPKRDALRAWVHELNGATFTRAAACRITGSRSSATRRMLDVLIEEGVVEVVEDSAGAESTVYRAVRK